MEYVAVSLVFHCCNKWDICLLYSLETVMCSLCLEFLVWKCWVNCMLWCIGRARSRYRRAVVAIVTNKPIDGTPTPPDDLSLSQNLAPEKVTTLTQPLCEEEIAFGRPLRSWQMLEDTGIILYFLQGANRLLPEPDTRAPKKLPFAQTQQATFPTFAAELPLDLLPPIHELSAEATAGASSRGTRIQTNWLAPDISILRISIEMDVPVRPRNCERAELRYVRTVNASSRPFCTVAEVPGWNILRESNLVRTVENKRETWCSKEIHTFGAWDRSMVDCGL